MASEPSSTMPTYKSLFNSDSYYTVDPARSIFSPAAYLVDLIQLKDNHITIDPSNKSSSFESRRPDIGKITLDAQNTNPLISKLTIVNKHKKVSGS